MTLEISVQLAKGINLEKCMWFYETDLKEEMFLLLLCLHLCSHLEKECSTRCLEKKKINEDGHDGVHLIGNKYREARQ